MIWNDRLDPRGRAAAGRRLAELGTVQLTFPRGVLVLLGHDLHQYIRSWSEVALVGGVSVRPDSPGVGVTPVGRDAGTRATVARV